MPPLFFFSLTHVFLKPSSSIHVPCCRAITILASYLTSTQARHSCLLICFPEKVRSHKLFASVLKWPHLRDKRRDAGSRKFEHTAWRGTVHRGGEEGSNTLLFLSVILEGGWWPGRADLFEFCCPIFLAELCFHKWRHTTKHNWWTCWKSFESFLRESLPNTKSQLRRPW